MSTQRESLIQSYLSMETIREFEKRVNAEIMNGQIPGFTQLSIGQEANAVGVCIDQIVNQMAKFRYMFAGQSQCPAVIRFPPGGQLQRG